MIGSLDPLWRTQLLTTPGSLFWNDFLVPKCGFADKYRVGEGGQGVAFGRELVDIRDVKALPPRMLLRIECNFKICIANMSGSSGRMLEFSCSASRTALEPVMHVTQKEPLFSVMQERSFSCRRDNT